MSPKDIERFWAKVDKSAGDDACWLWTGARYRAGYGSIKISGVSVYAHRVSFELAFGPLGELHRLHKCDTPACVNPSHLFSGTHMLNMVDRDLKGRTCKCEASSAAKVSRADVEAIRSAYSNGVQQKTLAIQYGITQSHVSRLIAGKRWRATA